MLLTQLQKSWSNSFLLVSNVILYLTSDEDATLNPSLQLMFQRLIKSFEHAFNGVKIAFLEEANFRIHCIATILVLSVGAYFKLSTIEWALILLAIALVLCAELMNTAVENLANEVSKEHRPLIKKTKDTAAGAVVVSAFIAAIIGLTILGPYVYVLVRS